MKCLNQMKMCQLFSCMIDLIFLKDDQYYFVDYKTDAFNKRRADDR